MSTTAKPRKKYRVNFSHHPEKYFPSRQFAMDVAQEYPKHQLSGVASVAPSRGTMRIGGVDMHAVSYRLRQNGTVEPTYDLAEESPARKPRKKHNPSTSAPTIHDA